MKRRKWQVEDEKYLEDSWGNIAPCFIAQKINRTTKAVTMKACKMGLGSSLEMDNSMPLIDFCYILHVSWKTIFLVWSKYRFPLTKIMWDEADTKCYYSVNIKRFWVWAKKNKTLLNFDKLEPNMLGKEPDWVLEKRALDRLAKVGYKSKPWTNEDDKKLVRLLQLNCYNYSDLTDIFRRTESSIQQRISILSLGIHPVKRGDNAPPCSKEDKLKIIELHEKGALPAAIAKILNKSEYTINKITRKIDKGVDIIDRERKSI